MKPARTSAFTLIEILVVVAIFSFLGILITRSILLTVGGSKKSESIVKVRENLDYSVGIIQRQLRNANSITTCPNSDTTVLNYVDQDGNASSFSCLKDANGRGYVASGSASLTSDSVNILTCSLTCEPGTAATPPNVVINLEAQDVNSTGVQNADVTLTTQVSLRNY